MRDNLKYIWTVNQRAGESGKHVQRETETEGSRWIFWPFSLLHPLIFFPHPPSPPWFSLPSFNLHNLFSGGQSSKRQSWERKASTTFSLVPQLISITFSRYSLWQSGQIKTIEQVERDMGLHCCLFSPHRRSHFCTCGSCHLLHHKLIK